MSRAFISTVSILGIETRFAGLLTLASFLCYLLLKNKLTAMENDSVFIRNF